jgi:ankyrin repeat protein
MDHQNDPASKRASERKKSWLPLALAAAGLLVLAPLPVLWFWGGPVVHYALETDNYALLKFTLAVNPRHANAENTAGEKALDKALILISRGQSPDAAVLLVEKGAELREGHLYTGISYGDPILLQAFVRNKNFLLNNTRNINDWRYPLILAIDPEAMMLERYISIQDFDLDKEKEIVKNQPDIVKILLKAGANPNVSGLNAPLHEAVRGGRIEIVQILLKYGADPSLKDKHGNLPAYYAEKNGHFDILRLLEEHAKASGE